MANTIVTRFAGKCADCETILPAGSQARYYGRGVLYGLTCHPQKSAEPGKVTRAARNSPKRVKAAPKPAQRICKPAGRVREGTSKRPAMGIPIPTANGTRSIVVRASEAHFKVAAQPSETYSTKTRGQCLHRSCKRYDSPTDVDALCLEIIKVQAAVARAKLSHKLPDLNPHPKLTLGNGYRPIPADLLEKDTNALPRLGVWTVRCQTCPATWNPARSDLSIYHACEAAA